MYRLIIIIMHSKKLYPAHKTHMAPAIESSDVCLSVIRRNTSQQNLPKTRNRLQNCGT